MLITKICFRCKETKPITDFWLGIGYCRPCRKEVSAEWKRKNPERSKEHYRKYSKCIMKKITDNTQIWQKKNPERNLYHRAKARAKRKGWDFKLNYSDIIIPEYCPVLGIKIFSGSKKGKSAPNAPSIDRIDNTKGYIKGNIIIVSNRVNILKNDATPDELIRIGTFYKDLMDKKNKK